MISMVIASLHNLKLFVWLDSVLDGVSLMWKFSNLKVSKIHFIQLVSRAFVPAVLLGEAEPKLNDQSPKIQEQPSVRN